MPSLITAGMAASWLKRFTQSKLTRQLVGASVIAMAIFTISAALFLVGILVADILLKVVDPRIEFSRVQG